MNKLVFVLVILISSACGPKVNPKWQDVIVHPNDVYENIHTGECWIYFAGDHIPVKCPSKEVDNVS